MSKPDALSYRAPPPPETSRGVYVLPVDLVKHIHEYGFERGHPSETSAARALLEAALAKVGA